MTYIFPALGLGVFLGAADQTLVVSSYGKIGSDLNALSSTSWLATAYFLTLTSFQPLYGKLSDIFGRKQCLLFAYVTFGLGCFFCGLARNMPEMIIARAVEGVGGGGIMTVTSVILSDVVSLRDRGTWQVSVVSPRVFSMSNSNDSTPRNHVERHCFTGSNNLHRSSC